MSLTKTKIKNAKTNTNKTYKLADGKGMYLLIHKNGSKYFRLNYRFNGKEKTLALGTYPEISLEEAREKRDTAKKQITNGIDPCFERKIKKIGAIENSFQAIALEWYEKRITGKSESHKKRTLGMMQNYLFPWLGNRPIAEIKTPELLLTLRILEDRGILNTAHRVLQISGQVFRYAIATGRAEYDISSALKGALAPAKAEHYAAITDPKEVRALLNAIDNYSGGFVVKSALKLSPLVFTRPGELRLAEWEHIDFEVKEWRYLVTKTNTQHIVPLSRQSLKILTDLQPLTGKGRYIFPNAKTPNGSRAMSDGAVRTALRTMGFSKEVMSAHGFRALSRTIQDEVLGVRPDFIEHQLAHSVRDANGRAYNRTTHLPERHKMMQAWADYLDKLKAPAEVIPLQKTA